MACLNGTISIEMQRRRAEVNIPGYMARTKGIPEGLTPCTVHGVFQSSEGDNYACPVAVCELHDGSMIEAAVGCVKFLDTVEGQIVE